MHKGNINIKITDILKLSTVIFSIYYISIFYVIAFSRANYPFDLEWMEGGMLEHVWRLLQGLPIYTKPSIEFIPFIYTPLYFYLSAAFTKILGDGYFPLRVISILSTTVIFSFTYLIIKEQTKSKKIGILSVGLFAACFQISGFWFDLARVDSLFLAFFIVSFYFFLHQNSFSLIISAIFASLAFLTKQTAILMVLPLMIVSVYLWKKRALFYITTFILLSGLTFFYFNNISNGWFFHWLVEIPAGHQWIYRKIISFWLSDIFQPLFFSFAISAIFLLYKLKSKEFKIFSIYFALIIGLFACSWISRIHLGGYDNVLMPAFLGLSLTFGLGLHELFKKFSVATVYTSPHIKLFILIAILAQFFTLFYNPLKQIPTDNDFKYQKKLFSTIKSFDGEVFIPDHQHINRFANKNSYSHYYVLKDFIEAKSDFSSKIEKDYLNLISSKFFDAIILDALPAYPEINKYYKLQQRIFKYDNHLKCKTGGHLTRPEYIFIPK